MDNPTSRQELYQAFRAARGADDMLAICSAVEDAALDGLEESAGRAWLRLRRRRQTPSAHGSQVCVNCAANRRTRSSRCGRCGSRSPQ